MTNSVLSPEIEAFLAEPNMLILATVGKNSAPQATPVWFLYENGHIMINSQGGRRKVDNMLRDPRVAAVVVDRNNPYRYVQVRGRIVHHEAGATGHRDIDRLSERYTGNARYQGDPDHKADRISFFIAPESAQTMGF